jgi:thioesterase domain-containing protein
MSRRPEQPSRESRRPGIAPRPLLTSVRVPSTAERLRVYGVHPGGLTATAWSGLADELPPDVGLSVLDLQNVPEYFAAALTGGIPDTTLPNMAETALAELAKDRPAHIPVALVGWSFGGVIAYEMARRLTDLSALVLLDSIAPTHDFSATDELLRPGLLIRWFAMYLAAKRGRPLTGEPNIEAPTTAAGLASLLTAATDSGVLPVGTEPAGLRKLYDSFVSGLHRNNHLAVPYQPSVTGRPIVLVKPVRSLFPEFADLGWGELGPVRVVAVPGDHYSILFDPSAWAVVADLVSGPPASAAA